MTIHIEADIENPPHSIEIEISGGELEIYNAIEYHIKSIDTILKQKLLVPGTEELSQEEPSGPTLPVLTELPI